MRLPKEGAMLVLQEEGLDSENVDLILDASRKVGLKNSVTYIRDSCLLRAPSVSHLLSTNGI